MSLDPNSIEIITSDKITVETTEWVYKSIYALSSKVLTIDRSSANAAYKKAKGFYDTAEALANSQIQKLKTIKPTNEKPVTIVSALEYVDKKPHVESNKKLNNTDDLNKWIDNVDTVYSQQLREMDDNVKTYETHSVSSDNAASAFSKLLADDNFVKIQNLEKQIEYRKFYFPGKEVKLKKVTDGDTAPLGEYWDPRYIQEYISIAKQNGFAQWFVKPKVNENSIEPCNVMTVWEKAKNGVDWPNRKIKADEADTKELINMFVGMNYMKKFGALEDVIKIGSADDGTPLINITETMLNQVYYNIDPSLRTPELTKIVQFTGQTEKQFEKNDVGYYAMVDSMAFDCAQLLPELVAREREYKAFKDKLWEILKENPALQLCTNNVNVTGNNINITQTMECVQTITNKEDDKEDNGNGGENDGRSDENGENEENDGNSASPDDSLVAPTPPEQQQSNETQESKLKTWHIVAIVVSVGVLVVVGVFIFFFIRSNNQPDEIIDEIDDETYEQQQQGGHKFVVLI